MRALVRDAGQLTPADGELFHTSSDKLTVIDRGTPMPDPRSGWIDFVVYTKPGPDGSGHIEIFANGNWIVTVKGHIGHNDDGLGQNQYFKFGPYRAGHSTVWTLYFDDFRRSPVARRSARDGLPLLGHQPSCDCVSAHLSIAEEIGQEV